MKKIFLTGVTGFLGRHIALQLFNEGNKLIFLSRSKEGLSAKERVKQALNFVTPKAYRKYRKYYSVLEGDVIEDRIGLSEEDSLELTTNEINEVWHTAGSLSFSEKERENIINVNTKGTEKILNFIDIIQPEKFHYISTAYINDKSHILEDELDCNREFNNPYEESKCLAEKQVREWSNRFPNTKTFIYRPSIIVGDSQNGKICNFNGYYRYMRTYHVIKRAILNKKNIGGVQKDRETLHLPICVPGVEDAYINIITIDYAVDMIMKLRDKKVAGIYHIVHHNPPTYGFLLRKGLRVLGISGPSVKTKKTKTKFLKKIEAHIEEGLHDYLPYISKKLVFDQTNIRKVLGKNFRRHKKITPELINTLIKYAVSCDFKTT